VLAPIDLDAEELDDGFVTNMADINDDASLLIRFALCKNVVVDMP
jgi:hypothetical protein